MAQSFERLTLDFGSGHDLRAGELSPVWGSVLSVDSLSLSLSLSLLLLPSPICALFLELKNK